MTSPQMKQSPIVFISYAHESDALRASVKNLAEWLGAHGCAVITDHLYGYIPPAEGWHTWMLAGIQRADIVLIVCTSKLKARYEKTEAPETGFGGTYEGAIVTQHIYDAAMRNTKFYPILPDGGSENNIPIALKAWWNGHRFPSGYEGIRHLIFDEPASLEPVGVSNPLFSPSSQRFSGERKKFLLLVRAKIEERLHGSIYDIAHFQLDLEERSAAIKDPFDAIQGRPNHPQRVLTLRQIEEILDKEEKALLILGDPGAGKTTLLFELALDLLERAEQDLSEKLPAIFTLNEWLGWKNNRLSKWTASKWAFWRKNKHEDLFEDWLYEKINRLYGVSESIAKAWMLAHYILPLLDGLDEVVPELRATCVRDINSFYQRHGFPPLVICSRTLDYGALMPEDHLCLVNALAVEILPLNRSKVSLFLDQASESLAEVNDLLKKDGTIWQLIDTPLMLDFLGQALKEKGDAQRLLGEGSLQERRTRVFDTYVNNMLERRKTRASYSSKETRHWLTALAQNLIRHDQNEFYLDQIQPTWIPVSSRRIINLIFAVITALPLGLLPWLTYIKMPEIVTVTSKTTWTLLVIVELGLAISAWTWASSPIMPVRALVWSWKKALMMGVSVFSGWPIFLSGMTAVQVLTFTLNKANAIAYPKDFARLSEPLSFIEKYQRELLLMWDNSIPLMLMGLGWSYIVAVWLGMQKVPILEQAGRNKAMQKSFQNASLAALAGAIGVVVIGLLGGGQAFVCLIFGLIVAVIFWLGKGGVAFLRHYLFRFALWINNLAPLNYIHFLDHATKLALLVSSSGGYEFRHRLLMEHLALSEPLSDDIISRIRSEQFFSVTNCRITEADVQALVGNYQQGASPQEIQKIEAALRLSMHVAEVDQLPSQLFGRLSPKDGPAVARTLDRIKNQCETSWLQPLRPTLARPGEPLRCTLKAHNAPVTALEISFDGRLAISGSEDRTIKVWNLDTPILIHTLRGHKDKITSLALSSNGLRAASCSRDFSLKFWNLSTGELISQPFDWINAYSALAINSDGRRVLTGSSKIFLWDTDNGSMLSSVKPKGADTYIHELAFSPDMSSAVAVSYGYKKDGRIFVWDLFSGRLEEIKRFPKLVWGDSLKISLSADANRVVIVNKDTIAIWDVTLNDYVHEISINPNYPLWRADNIALRNNEPSIIISSYSDLVCFDAKEINELHLNTSNIGKMAASADGHRVITSSDGGIVKVWDINKTPQSRNNPEHLGTINVIGFTQDGRRIVSGSSDSTLKVWSSKSGRHIQTLKGHSSGVSAIAFDESGSVLVSTAYYDSFVNQWNLTSYEGRSIAVDLSESLLIALGISQQKGTVVGASQNGSFEVWESEFKLSRWEVNTHSWLVTKIMDKLLDLETSVALTPDGCRAIVGDWSFTVWNFDGKPKRHALVSYRSWELSPLRSFWCISSHLVSSLLRPWVITRRIALTITPDGKHAASTTLGNSLILWDLENFRMLRSIPLRTRKPLTTQSRVAKICLSDDCRFLVTGSEDGQSALWKWALGAEDEQIPLGKHAANITSIHFTPDNRYVVSASEDQTLSVWSVEHCKLVASFSADAPITCCAISPDGRTIAAGDRSGVVHILHLEGI